jgi:lactoylglutathione lyase
MISEATMTDHESTARVTGVRTIGIPVRDQDRALQFYSTVLGLEKSLDAPFGSGRRWIELRAPGSDTTLALVPATAEVPAAVETGIRLSTADAGAMHARLLAHGVAAGEVLRWPGVPPMFNFRDVDGNGLEMLQET